LKKKEGISRSSLLFHRMKREKQEQKLGRSAPLSLCVSFTAGFLKKESGVIIIHARLRERKKK